MSANSITTGEINADRGLDQQLIAEINVIVSNALVSIEDLNAAVAESSVCPLVQTPAKETLQQSINERGTTLQMNLACRSMRSAVRRLVIRCLVLALGSATLTFSLVSASAQAGNCTGQVCGTVVNQSKAPWAASVLIANNWNGTAGSGKTHWLPPGANSSRVDGFRDTDAVRFTAGCSVQFTVDPAYGTESLPKTWRGSTTRWFKIRDDEVYRIKSVVCPR